MLLFSRQGKCRLQKWFVSQPEKSKKKITRELIANILTRKAKMSSFLEWKDLKIVYKRYSIYECALPTEFIPIWFTFVRECTFLKRKVN